jgi:hypothetical protein
VLTTMMLRLGVEMMNRKYNMVIALAFISVLFDRRHPRRRPTAISYHKLKELQ